ncbi:d4a89675-cdfe-496c-967d-796596d77ec4 [Sclerotinia trifoliorum]|uniref:D4a89675-cdfe-496c-967d-796596d77ec4 n=1 Tax=Sclerotinia trifoliorum TaxID=28548 RepID=A0A8H2ZT63_9HELO|nr:d4a89675-cdfe-496c-967d-796596d77ec4 [Sclerotinia trifoliorum]
MFTRHVQSAIGGGRPLTHDLMRVSEGIQASLRAFSSSVRRSEEGDDQLRSTRAERSSNAVNDISSLASQPSRGIDARSLAARPPPGQSFVLSRRIIDSPSQGRGPATRHSPNYRGRGGALYVPPTGARRGGARASPAGGRGGAGKRGRGGMRRARITGPKPADVELDEYDPPYTLEEQQYLDSQEGGEWVSYNPVTSMDDLESWGPAIATSESTNGLKESIIYKMQLVSGTLGQRDVPTPPERHLANVERGLGTVFESREEKETLEKWRDGKEEWRDEVRWKVHKDYKIEGLRDEEKEAILKEMVAGVYKKPGDVKEDLLREIERITAKNETFLKDDSRLLEEKIQSMLPAA